MAKQDYYEAVLSGEIESPISGLETQYREWADKGINGLSLGGEDGDTIHWRHDNNDVQLVPVIEDAGAGVLQVIEEVEDGTKVTRCLYTPTGLIGIWTCILTPDELRSRDAESLAEAHMEAASSLGVTEVNDEDMATFFYYFLSPGSDNG